MARSVPSNATFVFSSVFVTFLAVKIRPEPRGRGNILSTSLTAVGEGVASVVWLVRLAFSVIDGSLVLNVFAFFLPNCIFFGFGVRDYGRYTWWEPSRGERLGGHMPYKACTV